MNKMINISNGNRRKKVLNKKSIRFLRTVIVLWAIIISVVTIVAITTRTAQATEDKSQQKYFKSITIHPGDTLWSIAAKYSDCHYSCINEYIKEIKSMNNLDNDMIISGKRLLVAYYSD